MQANNFLDRVKIYVKAGKGGDGCLSFRREKFIAYGGPNGGNGGKGGDIILQAEPNLTTLQELACNPHIEAANGEKGGTYNKTGLNGEDKTVLVPLGTVIKLNDEIVADLTKPYQKVIVARGGRGGRGNQSFKTKNNTAPRIAEIGQKGEELTLILELKVLADVGLVGLPNAGKSTFLTAVTAARPKIANYPFTTLNPNLGICQHKNTSFIIADIPGIIEGASEGKGLGHQFLKHIERTRVLVHLVDPSGFENFTPLQTVKTISDELKNFDKNLAKKPRIIVVNKSDLDGADKVFKQIEKKFSKKYPVFLISAAARKGLAKVLDKIVKTLTQNPIKFEKPKQEKTITLKVEPFFTVTKLEENRFQISGKKAEDFISMTNFSQPQAVQRLWGIFKKVGLEKELLKQGVQDGDIIVACGKEFEWNGAEVSGEVSNLPERLGGYKRRDTKQERLEKRRARRQQKFDL